MRALFILVFFCTRCCFLDAQPFRYKLEGKISGIKHGKVFLYIISDKKYYGKNATFFDSASIQNGRFTLTRKAFDKAVYPYKLYIESEEVKGETAVIFLEAKDQVVIIDTIDEYIPPDIANSAIQQEMKKEYMGLFREIVTLGMQLSEYEELLYRKYGKKIPTEETYYYEKQFDALLLKGDSVLLEYARKHPNSYVTLWKLIERFESNSYKKEYMSTYSLLSGSIKKTAPARTFMKEILVTRKIALGSKFPQMTLLNGAFKAEKIKMKAMPQKYLLVDFWFSNCVPCLKQFPEYKRLYTRYNQLGFDLVGISVDRYSDTAEWRKIISRERIIWKQYLDVAGVQAGNFRIKAFPTNYLLDENGIIVKRNINQGDLEKFLEEQLVLKKVYDVLSREPQ